MVKVSDEHTFLVCGGMIEEDQFVSLLQGIQIDLVKKNPGAGFENTKWRYNIDFIGDAFNDLSDVYDVLLEDLQNLRGKNAKLDFLKDISSLMTRFPNQLSNEYIYLKKLESKVMKIPFKEFNPVELSQKITYDKSKVESKIVTAGNIGYVWVSDPRVFEYLSSELSGVQTLGEYLNYLYINDRATYDEFERIYTELLESYTEAESLEFLEKIYKEEYISKFSTTSKIFGYEYNTIQKGAYGRLFTPSKPRRCGKYLTLNDHQGYVEFNKAAVNLTKNNDKKYLIASNPGNISQEELMNKIGIFDVNIIQSDTRIILSSKTEHSIIFFNAIYNKGIKVRNENGDIHVLKFEFANN